MIKQKYKRVQTKSYSNSTELMSAETINLTEFEYYTVSTKNVTPRYSTLFM